MIGCGRPVLQKSLCNTHYYHLRRTGETGPPDLQRRRLSAICKIEGCAKSPQSLDLCAKHLSRFRTHGDPYYELPTQRDFLCVANNCEKPASTKHLCKKHYHRTRWLHERYGLSLEMYEELLKSQGGSCAICYAEPPSLHVDHDHACCDSKDKTCGRCIRSLLCRRCNNMLGMAHDDVRLLHQMITYLENHREEGT